MLIALDSGPLSDIVNPNDNHKTRAIRLWMAGHLTNGASFLLAEINDYEVRRNEILETLISPQIGPSRSEAALYLLDQLKSQIIYSPLTTRAMLKAAEVWAERRQGSTHRNDPNRSPKLDGDAILTAQCIIESETRGSIIIATENLKDFLFMPTPAVTADEWSNI